MYPVEYLSLILFYVSISLFLVYSLSKNIIDINGFKKIQNLFLNDSDQYVNNCDIEKIFCIHDCSFLCLNGEKYNCVDNVCLLNSKNGHKNNNQTGIKMLNVKNESGVGEWQYMCIDPTILTGEFCDKTVIDICEKGIFLFGDNGPNKCICNPPYILMWDKKNRPHCLEKNWKHFFKTT